MQGILEQKYIKVQENSLKQFNKFKNIKKSKLKDKQRMDCGSKLFTILIKVGFLQIK